MTLLKLIAASLEIIWPGFLFTLALMNIVL